MLTSKIFKYYFIFTTSAIIFCIVSCHRSSRNPQHTNDVNKAIKTEIEKYTYPLPSPFDASQMLQKIGAEYLQNITNQPEKAENYFTEKSKAINLGIYSTDLAYATTYNKRQDIQNYLKSSEILVRELDFTAAFSNDLPDRIEENLENKDELVKIITDLFQNAYAYLNQQGRDELSYLVLCGTVVEGLYLATHISENTFQNPQIISVILLYKEPLADLLEMMKNKQKSPLLHETFYDIQYLNKIYDLEPGNTSITEKQIRKLTEAITEIRTKYCEKE